MLTQSKNLVNGYRLHISVSNSKTGIASFSFLAGGRDHVYDGCLPHTERSGWISELVTKMQVCGTCSGDCPGCYAKKYTRYPEAAYNLIENTLAAKAAPVETVLELETMLFEPNTAAPELVRINDSGDFISYEYFAALCDMIKRHPETRFGAYTKEAEIVYRYGLENLPENFSLQCSPWPGYCEPIGNLPQFCYDNGTDPELAKLPHCPAVDKNGKRTGVQCKDCKHCYRAKRGERFAVYAH